MIYVDTSAALKVLLTEPESDAIDAVFASEAPLVSSQLLSVELHSVVD